jgi:hypothetical protein
LYFFTQMQGTKRVVAPKTEAAAAAAEAATAADDAKSASEKMLPESMKTLQNAATAKGVAFHCELIYDAAAAGAVLDRDRVTSIERSRVSAVALKS